MRIAFRFDKNRCRGESRAILCLALVFPEAGKGKLVLALGLSLPHLHEALHDFGHVFASRGTAEAVFSEDTELFFASLFFELLESFFSRGGVLVKAGHEIALGRPFLQHAFMYYVNSPAERASRLRSMPHMRGSVRLGATRIRESFTPGSSSRV